VSKVFGRKGVYTYGYGLPWCSWKYPEDVLFPYAAIEFETGFFSGPNDPDKFLKIHYGNYMELPPEDNRNPHQATYKIW
jgi:lipopolysaccharide cholinephosphotransferase